MRPASGDRRTATPGVQLRLVDDDGETIETSDAEAVGEILVAGRICSSSTSTGPTPLPTRSTTDGSAPATWPPGARWLRCLIGRRHRSDQSGDFKIGAAEIEAVPAEHPGIADRHHREPDPDLVERIVA